jgi:hypothetical protein
MVWPEGRIRALPKSIAAHPTRPLGSPRTCRGPSQEPSGGSTGLNKPVTAPRAKLASPFALGAKLAAQIERCLRGRALGRSQAPCGPARPKRRIAALP